MPFGEYKSLGTALSALQVTSTWEEFVQSRPISVSEQFRSQLQHRLKNSPVSCSESAVCENLIYPVLMEVVSDHEEHLVVWSHFAVYQDETLLGIPDYILANRSPLGIEVMGTPLAMIMEAKRNDFDAGWGQCLAAMCAAQALNGDPQRLVYGGVSDGFVWRFGKLQGRHLARDPRSFILSKLDELFAALNHVLELCKQQVLTPVEAAIALPFRERT